MCDACWKGQGSPKISSIQSIDCYNMIKAIEDDFANVRSCHCVVDDYNVEDKDIDDALYAYDDGHCGEDQRKREVAFLIALRQLTVGLRYAVLGKLDEFY